MGFTEQLAASLLNLILKKKIFTESVNLLLSPSICTITCDIVPVLLKHACTINLRESEKERGSEGKLVLAGIIKIFIFTSIFLPNKENVLKILMTTEDAK